MVVPLLGTLMALAIVAIVALLSTPTLSPHQAKSVEGGFAPPTQWVRGAGLSYYRLLVLFLLFDVEAALALPLLASGMPTPMVLALLAFMGGRVAIE